MPYILCVYGISHKENLPSEAMIMKTSSSVRSYTFTSGSAMTPTFLTAWSPILRDIASPIMV